MSDDSRRRILARRAGFVAAAMTVGTAAGVSACAPQVCLEMAIDCDADARRLEVQAPATACAGDPVLLTAVNAGMCGSETVTSAAVFATSDPELLVIEGSSARALRPGTVTVTALFEGQEAKATLVIEACSDAAPGDSAAVDAAPDSIAIDGDVPSD